MNRREFLKLAAAFPVVIYIPDVPDDVFNGGPTFDYISGARIYGVAESSSMASFGIDRGFYRIRTFHLNAWGGLVFYNPPPGDEIIWTDDLEIKVEGLAVADVFRRDKVERYGPYGLISTHSLCKAV